MARYGFVVDTTRCIGCNFCSLACKVENNIPDEIWWTKAYTDGGEVEQAPAGEWPDNLSMAFMTVGCQHCDNPSCVKACPVGATYKDADTGIVRQDMDKCIGCRICMAACPYNARVFNWSEPERDPNWNYGDKDVPVRGKGVVEKCTLCKERTDRGDEPMCVACCPTRARTFGDLDDPDSEISRVVRERKAGVLLEEQVRYFN